VQQQVIPECFDTVEDALKSAVMAMGGFKEVGRRMRPDFTHSGEWLRKCLSDDRRERLEPGQVLWILREAKLQGFHSAMDYISGDAGYKATPLDLPAQMAAMQETIQSQFAALNATMASFNKLQQRAAN
jgi:hypothetical protein